MSRNAHTLTVFERPAGLSSIDLPELWRFRKLFLFLVRRHVLVRYAQTALGILWVILQPGLLALVIAFVFERIVRVPTGGVPYWTIALTGIVTWVTFSGAVTAGADSLRTNRALVTNVYCPRLLLPLVPAVAGLVDLAAGVIVTVLVLALGGFYPTLLALPVIPLLALQLALIAAGLAYWFSALSARFRDAQHLVPFFLQVAMYASPVIYPASLIPAEYRWLFWANPLVAVIESFRSVLLRLPPPPPEMIAFSLLTSALVLLSGAAFFRQQEPVICDVL